MSSTLDQKRHSLAHLLAAAVVKLWPETKITIGPVVENGFYYDLDLPIALSDKDLPKVEKVMREILKTWKEFSHRVLSPQEAEELFKDNPYKLELIAEIVAKGEPITVYRSGDFEDLCRGDHVANASDIRPDSFTLVRSSGAYWRGSEKNKMLTRIYGVAFDTKEELEKHLTLQEEAKKRDHKKLGKELGLFVFSELVGPGLPIYTPRGAIVRREIIRLSDELQREIGYEEVHTPNMNKAELFKVSGHYEKYREDMFKVVSQYTDEEYFLKPMNCPQHTQVYAAEKRSYRDLPIRLADFANLYRDEKPGQLSGLTRLRSFCQDDGHAFCREDQIADEFKSVLSAIKKALTIYGMEYKIRLSLWDPEHTEKYLGNPETWDQAQTTLEKILKENNLEYFVGVGEAAIYGPKMDLITRDSLGREWQISTIQLDFVMPQRFSLTYTDADGKEKTPVMIHRALVGSPERFLGVLIEHYAGAFPAWLAPVQVEVLSVGEKFSDYAATVATTLREQGFRAHLDTSNESVGKKIREGKKMKTPYLIVVGEREMNEYTVTVESRDRGSEGQLALDAFMRTLKEEVTTRARSSHK